MRRDDPAALSAELYAEMQAGGTSATATAKSWPAPINLAELATQTPRDPHFILEGWIPAGYLSLLAGHGGVGKSILALMMAVCIALGLPFYGIPTTRRRVGYFAFEDRIDVLHWRLWRICRALGVDMEELQGHLFLFDLVGVPGVMFDRSANGTLGWTTAYAEMQSAVAVTGAQVLFIDGIADVYGASEISRGDVKSFASGLIATTPKDGALVLIGHVNRVTAGGGDTSEGYSGSTAWHNAARARLYLRPEPREEGAGGDRTGDLLLTLQKNNLGPAGASIRLRWDSVASTLVGEVEVPIAPSPIIESAEKASILAAIAASTRAGVHVPATRTGARTAYQVLATRPELKPSLATDSPRAKAKFWRLVEQLRQDGELQLASVRTPARKHVDVLQVKERA